MSKYERIHSVFAAVAAACLAMAGRTVTVQPVADVSHHGAVWDLTCFEPAGKELDLRISESDSLASVWLPDTRFDFLTESDTIALLCEETRVFRVVFSPASPEWSAAGDALSAPFTARGRMYQSEYISAVGSVSLSAPVRVTLRGISGDTISGARLDRTSRTMRWSVSSDSTSTVTGQPDTSVYVTRIDRLRLTAPGESFPRAMKKVVTTSCGGETIRADSTAWIMTTPVAAVPRTRSLDVTASPDTDAILPGPGGGLPSVTVTAGPDVITVTPSLSHSAAGLRVAVNDIAGRSYIDTHVPGDTRSGVDISMLPRGEYLIQVLSGDTPVAAIKYVKH